MESVEIRHPGEMPTIIQIRSERVDRLRRSITQHESAMRDLEEQAQRLTLEIQRLDRGDNHSLETSQRRAAVKQQLQTLDRQIIEHQSHKKRIDDECRQWKEEIGIRQFRRRLLWREMAEARPGPVSDWSYTRMYAIGEKEQRTTGDVKRDLVDTITWLLNFSGPDAELTQELQQLRQQPMEGAAA